MKDRLEGAVFNSIPQAFAMTWCVRNAARTGDTDVSESRVPVLKEHAVPTVEKRAMPTRNRETSRRGVNEARGDHGHLEASARHVPSFPGE